MHAKKNKFLLPLVLLLLLLCVMGIPLLTSTPIGQRTVVKLLNRKLKNKAEIKKISLSWLGPQRMGGLIIKNRSQEVLFHADQIIVENSLPSLLWNGIWKSHGTIGGLSIEYPVQLMEEGSGTFLFNGKNQLSIDVNAVTPNKTPFHILLQGALAKYSSVEGILDIQIDSHAGSIKGSLAIGDRIQLQDHGVPLLFDWSIDPKVIGTNFWPLPSSPPDKLTVLKPLHLSGSLSYLDIPLKASEWHTASIALEVKAKQLHLQSQAHNQELFLKKMTLTLKKEARAEDLEFSIIGKAADTSMHGDFTISGTMRNLLTNNLTLALQAKAAQLSIPLITALLPIDKTFIKQLTTLVGKKVDIDATVYLHKMNGPIQASLVGDLGHFSINGRLQGGKLQLKEPLNLVTNVTEDLGRDVLQPLIPLFSGIMAAEKPLKITIEPHDFILPIDDIRIDTVDIGKMKIDLGVLHFSNHGELAKILRPFRGKHDEPITLWFTPLYLSLKGGIVTVQRTDVLISNRYPAALWGTINTLTESINMYVALSSEALNRALNLSLPPQQKMTILPLKGRNGRLSIDTSGLKVQIASILAQFLTPAISDQSFHTQDEAATDVEMPLPPATTAPLPWENEARFKNSSEQREKRKDKKQTQSQLEKKGRALLKRLL